MSSRREMPGLVDYSGTQFGTLDIGQMTRRNPEPRYTTTCRQCGAASTASQSQIRNGSVRCLASNHDRPVKQRERLDGERAAAAQREAERLAEDREASLRKMDDYVGDYTRPERYRPEPTPREMSQRERDSLREYREAEQAAEHERQRPIIEAQRQAETEQAQRKFAENERREKQTAYWRDCVLNDRDPRLFVSPELATASMPDSKARAFNAEEVQKFIAQTPEYADYKTPENADNITGYLSRNGVHIADAATFRAAFVRLRDLGIVTKKPAPVKPVPPTVERRPAPEPSPKPTGPKTSKGRDPMTGLDREYTQREVDRMSSAEYRKAFPVIDSVRDLFAAIEDQNQ